MSSSARPALATVLALVLASAPVLAERRTSLRWEELAPVISGRRVWISLPSGRRVSGVVREVAPAALRLEVKKDVVSVPRSEVDSILLTKPAGHKGLIIGGAIGLGIGATTGLTLGAIARNEGATGPAALYAASIAGPVVLGFGLGALADLTARHRTHRIVIVK